MFTYKELHLIDKGYFKVLRYPVEDNFIEIQSKNTKIPLDITTDNYDYYHVIEFPNGKIELEPRVLMDPFEISEDTLRMVDASMKNLKKGIASEPVDLSAFAD